MELEREPRRPTPPQNLKPSRPSQPSPTIAAQTSHALTTAKKPLGAREVCLFMGVILTTVGLIGFVVSDLLGAHLSYLHNVILVIPGFLALGFGLLSPAGAPLFSLVLAGFFGLLGILGFAFGVPGQPTLGNMTKDPHLWQLAPEILEFGTVDHSLHLLFAIGFLFGAALSVRNRKRDGKVRI